MGSRSVPFTKTIYIDDSDFKEQNDDPNFYRLSLGKSIGLLNVPGCITAASVGKDATTGQTIVYATYEAKSSVKPKAWIQWIAESPSHQSPLKVEARLYQHLFKHANPLSKEDVPGGWLSDIDPDSLVIKKAYGEPILGQLKKLDKFQAIRVGYFCVDSTTADAPGLVLNRTCTLKEDNKKDK
jgi:glutaminyl-tRNA synthetase